MSKLLAVAEMHHGEVDPATLATITFAQKWQELTGGSFAILHLSLSENATDGASKLVGFGADKVFVMSSPTFEHPSGESACSGILATVSQYGAASIAAGATSFGREFLPRVAAHLECPMLSDVLAVSSEGGDIVYRRPIFAGNILADMIIDGEGGVFSIRGTAFGVPKVIHSDSPIETLAPPETWPASAEWISTGGTVNARPDLTAAKVVVSGGRPLGTAEKFEQIIGGLADKLGGAVGATRAAVDSGMAANELQVGQTGKTVAPELYIAAGISGSVQHMAGMKDSKVIVAINTDPDAPIFEIADYGLVADLFQAVPELTSKLVG